MPTLKLPSLDPRPAVRGRSHWPLACAAWLLVALCTGCDDPPPATDDPYAERVRADIEACQGALQELALCGPAQACFPNTSADIPLSLKVLANCAASVCASASPEEGDQCRFDAMVVPGSQCAEARFLCEWGDLEDSWAELE